MSTSQPQSSNESSSPTVGRRTFLAGLAAAGGAAAASGLAAAAGAGEKPPAGEAKAAAESPKPAAAEKGTSARGSVLNIKAEMQDIRDPETGARVVRLTGDGSENVHPYFTSPTFLGEGAERLILASKRSGRCQHYMLEVASGRLVQLTDGAELSPFSMCVDAGGRVFYFDGPVLHSVKVDSLEDRELYRVPDGYKPYLPTCTANGSHVAFAYGEKQSVSTESGRIYSTMAETYYQHPTCVVMRIDSASGELAAVWGERAWISHVLIHPTRPNLILFCHEGGSNVAQRMWIVDADQARARQARPLYPQRPGEFCVHEFFTRDGDVGFQYALDVDGRREEYNCFIRPDGTWIRQYLFPSLRPGHFQANSTSTLFVGDRAYRKPGDKDSNRFMALMTHVNGRVQVRRLCRHDTSWKTQPSHPHPVFSADDKWVAFNSDNGGQANVYMAEVGSAS